MLLFTKGLNYGVDFVGGSVAQIEFSQTTNGDAIQKALAPLDLGEITVQDFGKAGQSFLARFETVKNIGSIGPKLETALDKTYGPGVAKVVRVESVGAKVGSDLRRKGFAAVIIATIFMGVYIAIQFRHVSWSFGAGAVIALIHDVLVVMCALVISQYQFDLTTLAAVLTVIGYSVHDTIIVSDRIREDSTKRRREPIASHHESRDQRDTLAHHPDFRHRHRRAALAARIRRPDPAARRRSRCSSASSPAPTRRFISQARWCCSGRAAPAARRRAPAPRALPDVC